MTTEEAIRFRVPSQEIFEVSLTNMQIRDDKLAFIVKQAAKLASIFVKLGLNRTKLCPACAHNLKQNV